MCSSRCHDTVILQEQYWPDGRCILGKAFQDRRLPASRQTADGDNAVMIKSALRLFAEVLRARHENHLPSRTPHSALPMNMR